MGVREFWDLTPAETIGVLKAAAWREEQAQKRMAWLAWHVAAMQRQKRLPPLARLLLPKPKKLSKEEMAKRGREHAEMVCRWRGTQQNRLTPVLHDASRAAENSDGEGN